jgi:hypothetical protein
MQSYNKLNKPGWERKMPDYDDTNKGVLFRNERKENEKHSDYNGNINVSGQEYWINAWIKEAKGSGKKFMSLSVKAKESAPATPSAPLADFDKDIPF